MLKEVFQCHEYIMSMRVIIVDFLCFLLLLPLQKNFLRLWWWWWCGGVDSGKASTEYILLSHHHHLRLKLCVGNELFGEVHGALWILYVLMHQAWHRACLSNAIPAIINELSHTYTHTHTVDRLMLIIDIDDVRAHLKDINFLLLQGVHKY